MANGGAVSGSTAYRLLRAIDWGRDHVRGGDAAHGVVSIVVYGDFLCPYCRRLRQVLARLRQSLGERLAYVFRHFPNERAHPGAEFMARAAEAAAKQDRFWEMHDWLYQEDPTLAESDVLEFARELGLDVERFTRDLEDTEASRRVEEDLSEGRRNGVTGTPTLFIDGMRNDGAWDFYSLLEALERPIAARVQRSVRAFANLPASGGLVLLLAGAAALLCANTPLAPYYRRFIGSSFGIGPPDSLLSMTVGAWCSEGLLAIFFLLVGLEIRREITAGALAGRGAAILPVLAAIGGDCQDRCPARLGGRRGARRHRSHRETPAPRSLAGCGRGLAPPSHSRGPRQHSVSYISRALNSAGANPSEQASRRLAWRNATIPVRCCAMGPCGSASRKHASHPLG